MDLEKGAQFIWENARMLERAIFEHRFRQAPPERITAILATYQTEDGGFGHALEPDLRASESQPLFAEFALRTLYDCGLRAPELAIACCDFLEQHADLKLGIPTLLPSSQKYPRADHWTHASALQPSFDRLTGLVGLANWQGISHIWLRNAVEVCFDALQNSKNEDAHTLQNAFCLLETLPDDPRTPALFDKLAGELSQASYFLAEAPVQGYGLTPLHFAPNPQSYCRKLFRDDQIEAHLDEMQSKQQPDGGWPIAWQPPGQMAVCEWRALVTVAALTTLRAYGRL